MSESIVAAGVRPGVAVEVRALREAELDDLPVTLPGKLTAPNVVR